MNRYKLRHKILELLNKKLKTGVPIYIHGGFDNRPISMTHVEIAKVLKLDEDKVLNQINYLRSIKHIELEPRVKDESNLTSVSISLLGTEAYANNQHKLELKITRSENFKRTINYIVIPLGIVAAIITIIGKIISTDFNSINKPNNNPETEIVKDENEINIVNSDSLDSKDKPNKK